MSEVDLATARRISGYLTLGMHHSTPDAHREIARLIQQARDRWIMRCIDHSPVSIDATVTAPLDTTPQPRQYTVT